MISVFRLCLGIENTEFTARRSRDAKFQITNSKGPGESDRCQAESLHAAKKFANSSRARHSRNQMQILRFAQNDMSS